MGEGKGKKGMGMEEGRGGQTWAWISTSVTTGTSLHLKPTLQDMDYKKKALLTEANMRHPSSSDESDGDFDTEANTKQICNAVELKLELTCNHTPGTELGHLVCFQVSAVWKSSAAPSPNMFDINSMAALIPVQRHFDQFASLSCKLTLQLTCNLFRPAVTTFREEKVHVNRHRPGIYK